MLDRNLSDHTKTSMKRREPTILRLAKTYNDLCAEMERLIRQRKAPSGAVVHGINDVATSEREGEVIQENASQSTIKVSSLSPPGVQYD